MREFTFGQVEAILARHNTIADHKRVAFGGRLKFLQKNGVPHRRTKPGRGKAASFSFSELIQIAAAVELLQAGLTPQKAARIISTNWTVLEPTIVHAIKYGPLEQGKRHPEHWILHPSELSDLMDSDLSDYDLTPVYCFDTEHVQKVVSYGEKGIRHQRHLVINGLDLVRDIVHLVSDKFRYASKDEIFSGVLEEIEKEDQRGLELSKLFQADIPKWEMPLHPKSKEPLDPNFVLWSNVHRYRISDPRFTNPAAKRGARVIYNRLSVPALSLLRYIAFYTWSKPDLTPEELNASGGLLMQTKTLRWGGEIDDIYQELINHEFLSEWDGDAGLGLTTLGTIATFEIVSAVAAKKLGIKGDIATNEAKGGFTDVSSEA